MKHALIAAAGGLALTMATPLAAQDGVQDTDAESAFLADLFTDVFTAEPLTADQEARLPAASAVVDTMMPEGFYAEMMTSSIDAMMGPLIGLVSGEEGARIVLLSRLALDPETLEGLSEMEVLELAALLDPGLPQRGEALDALLKGLMGDIGVALEPGFRAGMARAYAVRFDEAQLADIAAFFATPTGRIYATENFRLMADPQVMAASMQAFPAMMERFVGIEEDMKAAFEALPGERKLGELAPEERARMAELLGVDESALEGIVLPPSTSIWGGDAEDASDKKGTGRRTDK